MWWETVSRIRCQIRIRESRNLVLRIRIRGAVIRTYGSGSRRPIKYGSGWIRTLPGGFWAQWKKICCKIGSKSLKNYKLLNFFLKFLKIFDIWLLWWISVRFAIKRPKRLTEAKLFKRGVSPSPSWRTWEICGFAKCVQEFADLRT